MNYSYPKLFIMEYTKKKSIIIHIYTYYRPMYILRVEVMICRIYLFSAFELYWSCSCEEDNLCNFNLRNTVPVQCVHVKAYSQTDYINN